MSRAVNFMWQGRNQTLYFKQFTHSTAVTTWAVKLHSDEGVTRQHDNKILEEQTSKLISGLFGKITHASSPPETTDNLFESKKFLLSGSYFFLSLHILLLTNCWLTTKINKDAEVTAISLTDHKYMQTVRCVSELSCFSPTKNDFVSREASCLRKKSLLKKHVKSEGALKSLKNPSMFYSMDDSGITHSVDCSEEEHR